MCIRDSSSIYASGVTAPRVDIRRCRTPHPARREKTSGVSHVAALVDSSRHRACARSLREGARSGHST
eukprot:4456213-Alexandrium_andersonii.AAC.1